MYNYKNKLGNTYKQKTNKRGKNNNKKHIRHE